MLGLTLIIGVAKYLHALSKRIPWQKFHKKNPLTPASVRIDPRLWLREELKRLRFQIDAGTVTDPLADELTYILRKYLHLKYDEPFPSRTTYEFKQTLYKFAVLTPLLEPFQRLDRFKFSPFQKEDPKDLVLSGIKVAENTLCGT